MKAGSRGAMFYSALGVMVVVIVFAVALQMMSTTYSENNAKDIEKQRLISAVYSTQSTLRTLAREAEYPVIWEAGHDVDSDGVNVYLKKGRVQLEKDLKKNLREELNRLLCNASDTCLEDEYVFEQGDIEVSVNRIRDGNVRIEATDYGLRFYITTYIKAGFRDIRYEYEATTVSEVPVRLFDMYDRALEYHRNYRSSVESYTTAIIYVRAYSNAYLFKSDDVCGPYLRDRHIAYDPVQMFLSGDVHALEETSFPADLADLGAIPATNWMLEWYYLGEPAFLPPGVDLTSDSAAEIKNGITDSSTSEELSAQTEEVEKLKAELQDRMDSLDSMISEINTWTSKSTDDYADMECCTFKSAARPILLDAIGWIGSGAETSAYLLDYAGEETSVEPDLQTGIDEAQGEMGEYADLELSLIRHLDNLDYICGRDCPGEDDCSSCNDIEYESCDDPDCSVVRCSKGDDFYECRENEVDTRSELLDCEEEDCDDEGNCETRTWTKRARIEVCDCRCHPEEDYVEEIKDDLNAVASGMEDNRGRLAEEIERIDEMLVQTDNVEAYNEKSEELLSKTNSGYDIVSALDYGYVGYNKGGGTFCKYYQPVWQDREGGVCAAWDESAGLYGGQIAAAAVASYLTGGALSPTIKYAVEFFPAVYGYEAEYNISEKIVDDSGRVMLHNLASDELYGFNETVQLYTHVAPEFVIYEDYPVSVRSATLGRMILYLYLPKVGGLAAAERGIASEECQGYSSIGNPCVYTAAC